MLAGNSSAFNSRQIYTIFIPYRVVFLTALISGTEER